MSNRLAITYRKLRAKLAEHGFVEKRVPGSHIVMEHKKSNTLLMLPALRNNSIVSSSQLAGIKRQVVTRGLIPDREFTRFMSPLNGNAVKVMPLQEGKKIRHVKAKVS